MNIPMICPQCGANIQIDNEKEYGFCSYCGTKIKVKEVIEIKHSGTVEVDGIVGFNQLVENGNAYLKLKDYGKAEKTFKQIINEYPAKFEGYKGLLTAYARNFEEDNLYAINQIQPLLENAKRIADDANSDEIEFINKIEEYYDRLSMVCDFNELKENFNQVDKSYTNSRNMLAAFVGIIVLLFLLMKNNMIPQNVAAALIMFAGVLVIGFLLMFIFYNNARKKLLAQIKDTDSIIDE